MVESGNSNNGVFITLVKAIGLEIMKLPKPYKVVSIK